MKNYEQDKKDIRIFCQNHQVRYLISSDRWTFSGTGNPLKEMCNQGITAKFLKLVKSSKVKSIDIRNFVLFFQMNQQGLGALCYSIFPQSK